MRKCERCDSTMAAGRPRVRRGRQLWCQTCAKNVEAPSGRYRPGTDIQSTASSWYAEGCKPGIHEIDGKGIGDYPCGNPDCPHLPCDDEWCVKNEPEHTRAEHIDPPHRDPGHEDYQSAEHAINEALGEHAWLLDGNHEGPSHLSSKTAQRVHHVTVYVHTGHQHARQTEAKPAIALCDDHLWKLRHDLDDVNQKMLDASDESNQYHRPVYGWRARDTQDGTCVACTRDAINDAFKTAHREGEPWPGNADALEHLRKQHGIEKPLDMAMRDDVRNRPEEVQKSMRKGDGLDPIMDYMNEAGRRVHEHEHGGDPRRFPAPDGHVHDGIDAEPIENTDHLKKQVDVHSPFWRKFKPDAGGSAGPQFSGGPRPLHAIDHSDLANFPNRDRDPSHRGNMADCPHTYDTAERDKSLAHSNEARDKEKAHEDATGEFKYHRPDPDALCPNCGAYKWLHTPKEYVEQHQDRMENLPKRTVPFEPLRQSLNNVNRGMVPFHDWTGGHPKDGGSYDPSPGGTISGDDRLADFLIDHHADPAGHMMYDHGFAPEMVGDLTPGRVLSLHESEHREHNRNPERTRERERNGHGVEHEHSRFTPSTSARRPSKPRPLQMPPHPFTPHPDDPNQCVDCNNPRDNRHHDDTVQGWQPRLPRPLSSANWEYDDFPAEPPRGRDLADQIAGGSRVETLRAHLRDHTMGKGHGLVRDVPYGDLPTIEDASESDLDAIHALDHKVLTEPHWDGEATGHSPWHHIHGSRKTAEWVHRPIYSGERITHTPGYPVKHPSGRTRLDVGDSLLWDSGKVSHIVGTTDTLLKLHDRAMPMHRSGIEGDHSKAIWHNDGVDDDLKDSINDIFKGSTRKTASEAKLPGGYLNEESEAHDHWAHPGPPAPYDPVDVHHGLAPKEDGHGPWHITRHPDTRAYQLVDNSNRLVHSYSTSGHPSYERYDHNAETRAVHHWTAANQDHGHIPKWQDRDGNEEPETGLSMRTHMGRGLILPGTERARRKGEPLEDANPVDTQHVQFHAPAPPFPHSTEDPRDEMYRNRARHQPAPSVLPPKIVTDTSSREHGTTYRRAAPHEYDEPGAFHEPSPDDEYHGPYKVIQHAQTGKFHVVDNQGRLSDYGGRQGMDDQASAEERRDYAEGRQRSKQVGRQIGESIFNGAMDILDPGGTPESRRTDRHTDALNNLAHRYEGGTHHPLTPGRFGADDYEHDGDGEGEPYYEVSHPSGYKARDYGGNNIHIYHAATGETAHDLVGIHGGTEGSFSTRGQKPEGFGHEDLHRELDHWVGKNGQYAEHHDPRIPRWQRRRGYTASLTIDAFLRVAIHGTTPRGEDPAEPTLWWRSPNGDTEVHVKPWMPDRDLRENYGAKPHRDVALHHVDTSNPNARPAIRRLDSDGSVALVDQFGNHYPKPPKHVMKHLTDAHQYVQSTADSYADVHGQAAEQNDIRSDLDRVPRDMEAERRAHEMFRNLMNKTRDDDDNTKEGRFLALDEVRAIGAQVIAEQAKDPRFKGVTVDEDDDGFYVRTHRARSKSYRTPEAIPQKDVDFIESTGAKTIDGFLREASDA